MFTYFDKVADNVYVNTPENLVLPKTEGFYPEETSHAYVSVLVNLSVLVLAGIQFISSVVASRGRSFGVVLKTVLRTQRGLLYC